MLQRPMEIAYTHIYICVYVFVHTVSLSSISASPSNIQHLLRSSYIDDSSYKGELPRRMPRNLHTAFFDNK
jgi:hypothetical protein